MSKMNKVAAPSSQVSRSKEAVKLSDFEVQMVVGGAKPRCPKIDDSCGPYHTLTATPKRHEP